MTATEEINRAALIRKWLEDEIAAVEAAIVPLETALLAMADYRRARYRNATGISPDVEDRTVDEAIGRLQAKLATTMEAHREILTRIS